ncbi:hypothetical protein FHW36_112126 [Chitinophaga polysaccharea]|uniref:Uncharacterized protein n=1 Tax=Chitinophaga polysaccharea TaxID=1293035 RepID=A0A561P6E1_9BACT|nr:hypothetical protein FHW36_112126 [Chitinophaga polysaccharea]
MQTEVHQLQKRHEDLKRQYNALQIKYKEVYQKYIETNDQLNRFLNKNHDTLF